MTSTGALSLGEFMCFSEILVNFVDRDSFSWKHSKHLMHRMSLIDLMLVCSPEGENSDLEFRLSLKKRETFKTHVKEASHLLFHTCLTASASASYCCGQQVGHKYLGQCLWP